MGNIIANIVVILILTAIAVGIILYLLRAKKSGAACVGCPYAKQCAAKSKSGGCSCSCGEDGTKSGNTSDE